MNPTRIINTILLWVIGLYLVLNYGFMLLRIPPTGGAGVPIGELVLLLTLITINYKKLLPILFGIVFAYPFLLWWVLGISRAFIAFPEYGMWALRDATHVLESLFLLAGFAFAANPKMIDRFFVSLSTILVINVIYALAYPLGGVLETISPTIIAGNGEEVPILFNYQTTPYLALMTGAYVLIFQKQIRVPIISHQPILIVAGLWGYTAALFQGRTNYLQIIAIMVFFALYRPKLVNRGMLAIVLLLGAVALVPVLGLQIKGRIGEEVSINFLIEHFLAIGGGASETAGGGLEGAAEGVGLRTKWWMSIYERLTSDIWHLLFGLGYGIRLTDFSYFGIPVREPHNSYISIVARIGLMGGIAWAWMHGLMLRTWHSGYKQCVRMGWVEGQNRFLIVMVFFMMVWVYAIGQDAFEKPFNTIPYYFFWGIVLRYVVHLRNGTIGPDMNGK